MDRLLLTQHKQRYRLGKQEDLNNAGSLSIQKVAPEAVFRDNFGANWSRQTDGQDHMLSQADALTKKCCPKIFGSLKSKHKTLCSKSI